jgi:hypothetical protein
MTLRLSDTVNVNAAEAVALTTHRTSDGKNHADVVTNTGDIAGGKGPGVMTNTVAGALVGGPTTVNSFIAPRAGTVLAVSGRLGTGCAAGETVTIDVQIAGVTCLTAPYVIATGDGTAVVQGTVDPGVGVADFAAGELITVIWTQADAGGPTSADLFHSIGWRLT